MRIGGGDERRCIHTNEKEGDQIKWSYLSPTFVEASIVGEYSLISKGSQETDELSLYREMEK
uniref:Uncharacterized protein n=1 Tax=Nelumbo nucifera TaxID=4432 RepID=A0A822Y9N6_NELNU|nr:TPA_asm: hypothetical protein HUJ06_009645 [Nelumbo nucifera]